MLSSNPLKTPNNGILSWSCFLIDYTHSHDGQETMKDAPKAQSIRLPDKEVQRLLKLGAKKRRQVIHEIRESMRPIASSVRYR